MILVKSYESIVERQQPPCGGKQTKLYDFRNVETDDPVLYVREHEPGPTRTWNWTLTVLGTELFVFALPAVFSR